eukprot:1124033-Pleurochrysis_carterae.AAC.1
MMSCRSSRRTKRASCKREGQKQECLPFTMQVLAEPAFGLLHERRKRWRHLHLALRVPEQRALLAAPVDSGLLPVQRGEDARRQRDRDLAGDGQLLFGRGEQPSWCWERSLQ